MSRKQPGPLIIIGGHEEKTGERQILKEVAAITAAGTGKLVVVTVATNVPEELAKEYQVVFRELGVRHLEVLDIRSREQAYDQASVKKLEGAAGIFFTGGDQLRLTSQLGNSPVYEKMCELHEQGGAIIGTSAGAAAIPEAIAARLAAESKRHAEATISRSLAQPDRHERLIKIFPHNILATFFAIDS